MRKTIGALVLLLLPGIVGAVGGGVKLMEANVDLNDKASLQRGAKLFVNYCLSCHSARMMRYNRMGKDLGLTDAQVEENLMFASEKVGELMTVSMREEDAKRWFGTPPLDLSLVARSRSEDWLFTYLLSFYKDDDPARPFGVNNLVFRDVAMPHVLGSLQGYQVPVYEEHEGKDGKKVKTIKGLELRELGTMTPDDYEVAVRDLVGFLVYVGEPAKLVRYKIGTWVLVFLGIFVVITYLLKKEYWKDVH